MDSMGSGVRPGWPDAESPELCLDAFEVPSESKLGSFGSDISTEDDDLGRRLELVLKAFLKRLFNGCFFSFFHFLVCGNTDAIVSCWLFLSLT